MNPMLNWVRGDYSALSEEICLIENGKHVADNRGQVESYLSQFSAGISDIKTDIIRDIIKSDKQHSFNWKLSGKHTGIFNELMPTGKLIVLEGNIYIERDNSHKVNRIEMIFDKQTIKEQIFPSVMYSFDKCDVFNNFEGEGKNIYNLLQSSRKGIVDSKHALIRALRHDALSAPDMTLLNHEELLRIKKETMVSQHSINLKNRHSVELFVYTPNDMDQDENLPTILHLHGGGWCMGSPEGYDMVSRKLALSSRSRVICPRYRLSPEHPYPAGFDDCCDVYQYLRVGNPIDDIKYNADKILVAGDSAGGTFAAALTLRMYDEMVELPNAVLLLSPATDMRLENYHSYNQFTKNNIMIDQGLIGLIRGAYVNGDMWDHPYVSPMRGDLRHFPKTLVMIGEEDPLYDENMTFVNKLARESASKPKVIIGLGMPHHYHTFIGLSKEVEKVYQEISAFINQL